MLSSLRKTQTILISIFSPKQDKKQVSLQIDLSHSKLSEKRFSLFSDHCNIILSTVKTFKSLAKIEKGWLIKDTGPFFTHAEFKCGPRKNITYTTYSGTKHLLVAYKLPRIEAKDSLWPILYFYYFAKVFLEPLKSHYT